MALHTKRAVDLSPAVKAAMPAAVRAIASALDAHGTLVWQRRDPHRSLRWWQDASTVGSPEIRQFSSRTSTSR
jgi:hypothetical protein